MKLLVTGANGLIGRATVDYLLEQGHTVRASDLAEETEFEGVEYVAGDIRDYQRVREQVKGCDAVVHLAALPSPAQATAQVTFAINVLGTYNIYEAAAQEGIKRVVQASSINAIGMTWHLDDFSPEHLPIDETHERKTTDPYSLSKHLGEDIGYYYWHRDQISGTGLRMPAGFPAEHYQSETYKDSRDNIASFLDSFLQLPQPEQDRLMSLTREKVLRFRRERPLEFATKKEMPSAELGEIPAILWESYLWHRFMLWALLDVRDAAQAFAKSVSADYEGFHPLFVNDTGNFAEYDAATLARLFFPGVPTRPEALKDNATLISIEKARTLIGFEPQFSVRN